MPSRRSDRSESSQSPSLLKQVGRYELVDVIASGGMATVYLGQASGPGGFRRLFAVKVCHPHLTLQSKYREMFLDEARFAGRIRHPNVVATLDVDDGEPPFMVMEYIEGASLRDLLKAAGQSGQSLSIPVILRIIYDVLQGLQAAHELCDDDGAPLNIVHRDISPHNVLVGVDGVTRITDFGVAWAEERLAGTESGEVKGKWSYMAPEQLLQQELTQKVDIFALSVVFWEALTGKRLFKTKAVASTASKVLSGPILKPSEYREEVGEELDRLLLKGLSRSPEARIQTVKDYVAAITALTTPMASIEAVRQLVEELCGERLKKRHDSVSSMSGVATPQKRGQASGADAAALAEASTRAEPVAVMARQRKTSGGRHVGLLVVVAVLLFLVAGVGLWNWSGGDAPSVGDRSPPESSETQRAGTSPMQQPEGAPSGEAPAGLSTEPPAESEPSKSPQDGALQPDADASTADEPREPVEQRRHSQKRGRRRTPRASSKIYEPNAI